jgi:hypothetical protein
MNSKTKLSRREAGRLGWEASMDVRKKHWKEFREKYEHSPKKCRNCNVVLTYEKRELVFCSSSCAASWNNSEKPKRKKRVIISFCIVCGKEIRSKIKRVFCSCACNGVLIRKKFEERMEKGTITSCYPSKYVKKYLIDKRGRICENCKLSEWMGSPIPLNVHHIDGDASNNRLENLQLLCLNCHGLTPTFGFRGKRRGTRKYRYSA